MKLTSLQNRLSRSLLAGWLVWSLAILGSLWWVIDHEIEELLDETLVESAEIIAGLLAYDAAALRLDDSDTRALPAAEHSERLIWQITNSAGRIALRSHRAPDTPLASPSTSGLSYDASRSWRVFSLRLPGAPDLVLHVGQETAEREEAAVEAARYAAATALCIGILVMLWTRVRLRRELAPLDAFSAAIRDYDPLARDYPLPPASHAELQPVRDAIEGLATRLAQRVENERAFSAHAAHALRTPLAGLDAQLAVAQREAPAIIQPRLAQARQAAGRLQRVVTALLALFRSGSDLHPQRFRISDLAASLGFSGLQLQVEGAEWLDGDPDLIAAALMNLIDNSARHHATIVRLQVTDSPEAAITIADDGSGIDPGHIKRLNQALAARNYAGHTGLGLMLADMVARIHGGRLEIRTPDAGCTVTLHLGPSANRASVPVAGL